MIIVIVILAVLLVGETGLMFWTAHTPLNPTKEELMQDHWFDFLNWASKPKNYAGLGIEYNTTSKPDSSGVSMRVPLPTESNFWLWYLEYKHGDIVRELKKSTKR